MGQGAPAAAGCRKSRAAMTRAAAALMTSGRQQLPPRFAPAPQSTISTTTSRSDLSRTDDPALVHAEIVEAHVGSSRAPSRQRTDRVVPHVEEARAEGAAQILEARGRQDVKADLLHKNAAM